VLIQPNRSEQRVRSLEALLDAADGQCTGTGKREHLARENTHDRWCHAAGSVSATASIRRFGRHSVNQF
jgi:hypothetical protein